MIRRLYALCPRTGLMVRLGALQAALAVLQGLLLGCLVPILRALLAPEPDLGAATPWLTAGAVGLVLHAVLTVISSPVGFGASMQLAAQLRHRIVSHVTVLPLAWFTGARKARLARAVSADVDTVAHLAVTIGGPSIVASLVPMTITAVTFAVDWRMGLVFLLLGPVAYLALRRAARVAGEADVELELAATEIAGRALELGRAQPVLRAAGHGLRGSERMRAALDEHRGSYRRGLDRSILPDLSFTGVVMIGFAVVLVLGGQLLSTGSLGVADTVALLVLAVRYLEPMGTLIELVGALRAMDNAIGRINDVLGTETLPRSSRAVRSTADVGIDFDGVRFSYSRGEGARPALADVSFHCPPGSTTALVGPSGSGKTTVTRLIARFADVDGGAVRIGGVDVREWDHEALLDRVAVVFQDVYLFDTTIAENLRVARPDASDEDLSRAARAARLDEVVERLPRGFRTRVGEGGAALSGGERQRVSIARAWLKGAPLVLIDEAASALDPENEAAIGAAIAELAADPERTVVVIAHRPATIAAADRVVTLDGGRVVECGAPEALRDGDGPFARLHDQYCEARRWHIGAGADHP